MQCESMSEREKEPERGDPISRRELARLEAENARLCDLIADLRHDLAQMRAQSWQETCSAHADGI